VTVNPPPVPRVVNYFYRMFQKIFITVLVLFCAGFPHSGDTTTCNFPVAAVFSEDMVTLTWSAFAGAAAYNVYADLGNGRGRVRANFSPVQSRNRFSFLWIESDGRKERVVKGSRLSLYVVPLLAKVLKNDTTYSEGPKSCGVSNSYFAGFSNVLDSAACRRVLQPRQATKKILTKATQSARDAFCGRFGPLAGDIDAIYKSKIDPRDEGACVPFSTMVAKYFTARGIPCYRVQGMFIAAFHSFNMVVVDSVEYVLDFTADQFVPRCAPVFVPRDWCSVDSCGRPTCTPGGTFTKTYHIETVFASDQITFTDTPQAREYQRLLDSLLAPARKK
jgi:hypothetical protein